jgi:hypothetical protein
VRVKFITCSAITVLTLVVGGTSTVEWYSFRDFENIAGVHRTGLTFAILLIILLFEHALLYCLVSWVWASTPRKRQRGRRYNGPRARPYDAPEPQVMVPRPLTPWEEPIIVSSRTRSPQLVVPQPVPAAVPVLGYVRSHVPPKRRRSRSRSESDGTYSMDSRNQSLRRRRRSPNRRRSISPSLPRTPPRQTRRDRSLERGRTRGVRFYSAEQIPTRDHSPL